MKEKEYLNYIPPNCTLLKTIEKLVGKRKRTYLIIVCKTHGEFKIRTDDLKHRGCKGCCRDSVKFEYDEKWKEDCTLIHSGKYNYNNTIVRNVLTHSEIFCNSCNSIFKQTPASHKSGQGCMICARVSAGEKLRNTMEHVITKAKELGFNYNFTNSVYKTCKDDIEIVCDKGHTFYQSPDELLNAEHGCQKCAYGKHSSKGEQEVYEFVSKYYKAEKNNRRLLKGLELDIFIPDIKVGIEYNGIYWHNDSRARTTHYNKNNICAKAGLHLIHIYEDEWTYKKEIVKNKLLESLRVYKNDHYNFQILKENNEALVELYKMSVLDSEIKIDGFYTMWSDYQVVGVASYLDTDYGRLITNIFRPIDAEISNFKDQFLKFFKNSNKDFYILCSLDWLDDLFVKNYGGIFYKTIKGKKRAIVGQKTYVETDKKFNLTLTKAGYAVYKI